MSRKAHREGFLRNIMLILEDGRWHSATDIATAVKLTEIQVGRILRGENVERRTEVIKVFGRRVRITRYRKKAEVL